MGDPESLSQILWSSDPSTTRAIFMVLGAGGLAFLTIHGPLALRLGRLFLLERRLHQLLDRPSGARGGQSQPDPELLRETMHDSPLAEAFDEFERRWRTAQLGEPSGRAPVRLADVFDDRPLLPPGPRRSLLPVLPGLFLGLGVFAALTGLIPGLSSVGAGGETTIQLALALRVTAWGFLCAIAASLAGRLLEGGFQARATTLDTLVESAFGSVSPGELAELTRQTQQRSLDTLGKELTQFANELNERLDRGLQRIEQSTARSANLVSQEQRGALHTVVQELSLSVRQGVEHHLGELRGALERAVEHQTSVTSGLAETFERMVENAETQDRVAHTLSESAHSVEEAARAMQGSTAGMQPVLEHLTATSRSLAETADRVGETQKVVARTAEGMRSSLEHAASGVDDQRQFIELSLSEIRRSITGLGDGLGDSLQRSLRSVDDVLGSTVGQLRETLAESNETIERLAGPIRAAEGSTRETHVALDRVRSEVEALGQWMSQAIKPLRSGLVDVDGRAEEITRAIADFSNQARQMDRTMEALREEIHEESRRFQGIGSELGRRLQMTTEVMGAIDPSDEAATRPRSRSVGRERSWAAAPAIDDATAPASDASPGPAAPAAEPPIERPAPATPPAAPLETPAASESAARDEEVSWRGQGARRDEATEPAASASATEREFASLPGYRLGAPRAQGPDPYERFDGPEPEGSNVRHFPTRDRELGEELKLSGLLGPSPPSGPGDEDATNGDAEAGAEDTQPVPRPRSRSRSSSSEESD